VETFSEYAAASDGLSETVSQDGNRFPNPQSVIHNPQPPTAPVSDTYRTITGRPMAETKVDGSRFLAEARAVGSRGEAEAFFEEIRTREHSATHHCTAFRVGRDGDTFHYNDDGEPSGTAGPPILRQIEGHNLTNTAVIVTRYYGGTKLGVGGLARAYGDAARRVLDEALVIENVVRVPIRLRFAYDDTSQARRILDRFDSTVLGRDFTSVTELTVGIRESEVDAFTQAFTNALGGRGDLRVETQVAEASASTDESGG